MPVELNHEDHVPPRRPPKIVSLALIVLGGAAVVVPVILLRRVIQPGKSNNHARRLGNAPPPPIRRTSLKSSFQSFRDVEGSMTSSTKFENSNPVPRRVPDFSSATLPLKTPTTKNADEVQADPLFSLKAFGIATCIVGVAAAAGVWTVRWSMDVETIDQFSAKMRHKLQSVAPALSARIYRTLTPSDSSQLSSVAIGRETPSTATEEDDDGNFDWEETSDRLSRAYEEGGLPKWFEVVGLVMEREAHIERRRREGSRSRSDR